MRIGIDARLYRESGVGRYIRNLLEQLSQLDAENQYFVFLRKSDFESLDLPKNFTKVSADFHWYTLVEQLKMPGLLEKYKLDLVHLPHFNVPLFYKGKFVVTIHDLIHQKVSMRRATTHDPLFYKLKQYGYSKVIDNAIKKSQKILTVSDFVKKEILEKWEIPTDKIVVTSEAVGENIVAITKTISDEKIQKVLKKFRISDPFIFYIGNAHPHKNIERLIQAFLVLQRHPELVSGPKEIPDRVHSDRESLKLVLSGHDHYFWERIKKENQHPGIIYTGFVSDEEMVTLYKSAAAFVMPSLEEGFGIPLLEAMACGCPVVSSDAASLPEIGGDACLYFNPKDINDMVEKISQILEDSVLRKKLVQEGEKRYQEFSWSKLAKNTLQVYNLTLER